MIKEKSRIIFLGTPDFAVASLKALVDHDFNVVAVVTAPDKPAGRGRQLKYSAVKEYAMQKSLNVLQPEKLKSQSFIEELRSYKADIQIVVAFRMLPEVVWSMPPLGTINVHASLLPQYRGAAPINWAIINGETQTGVTTFKLQHEIDTGDLLLQSIVDILPSDDFGSLYTKLMEEGAHLLLKTMEGIIHNSIEPTPQMNSGNLTHAPKIFKETCVIDWNNKGSDIVNFIRGLSPFPGAFTYLNDKQLKIFKAVNYLEDHQHTIGTYTTDHKSFLHFYTQDGYLELVELQIEGKKRMMTDAFLRGNKI